ncbi:Acyl-coenzyme A dehydrogenase [Seminavis robusta]|uniref:Acyl-coenzyme A dehydrogenase n=1 Tax=Seminavis robusta TaxID=568900 RepID=A0A9N8HGG1_9STRA|nr:Acyl-coenzyme A dehydrogenase [Seminavis robusta]|eukprot:Sro576_g169470.1 Acyl-coenzyme A dehydrogenase (807) ;mRNA; r:8833-11515
MKITQAATRTWARQAARAGTPAFQLQQQRGILGLSSAIDTRLYRMAKGVMPTISATEQTALGCGTIGFDRDIFTGNPSLKKLVDTYQPKLTPEEEDFINKETNALCDLINDHEVTSKRDFTKEAWDFMRDQKFFGLKIPKEWGGLGFSTQAVSVILAKLAIHCTDANATVAVPNSLGPGELLVRYGTQEQKEYFLPRLADGTLIPCFGLTGPHSGSDATSLIGSYGVVEERDGVVGVRATFKKRYITLAPVAGVVGIGLNLQDPNGLLKGNGGEGFTVALLERHHEGLRMGPRHKPLNAAFMNGTVEGEDVWIPMSHILGGQERCGFGWHMFVECLAEGRGVSLPAGAAGSARGVVTAVGAYARVRKQFKVPIAEFGGIQEALADAGSDGLICLAGTDLMNAIIDNHEAPMVISSVMKQNCTERGRRIIERAMDVAAGSAICLGDKNLVGNPYMSMPIGITVEGANIMTRSFQIIGQGLTRCHPHMIDIINALQMPKEQEAEATKIFVKQFYNVLGHGVSNFGRSISRGISSSISTKTRSKTAYKDGDKLLAYHEAQLLRLSANFAMTADLCFTLGGRLKFEELLMGRLADALGAIFLGYSTLHHYTRRRGVEGLEAITEHAMQRLEYEAQEALKVASDNFPGQLGPIAAATMKAGCFPLGGLTRHYKPPSDELTKEVSRLITTPSGLRDMFAETLYGSDEATYKQGEYQGSDLAYALPICVEADKIASTLRREKREPTQAEADKIAEADALRDILIQVDVFPYLTPEEGSEGYVRPAILGTEERLANLEQKTFDDVLEATTAKTA